MAQQVITECRPGLDPGPSHTFVSLCDVSDKKAVVSLLNLSRQFSAGRTQATCHSATEPRVKPGATCGISQCFTVPLSTTGTGSKTDGSAQLA